MGTLLFPRGIRNLNPLNIMHNPANKWQGMVGQENGYVIFRSWYWGFRAALRLIHNYIQKGYVTPERIIYRWCPDYTAANYVKAVGKFSQMSVVTAIDPSSYKQVFTLVRAMIMVECGVDYDLEKSWVKQAFSQAYYEVFCGGYTNKDLLEVNKSWWCGELQPEPQYDQQSDDFKAMFDSYWDTFFENKPEGAKYTRDDFEALALHFYRKGCQKGVNDGKAIFEQ